MRFLGQSVFRSLAIALLGALFLGGMSAPGLAQRVQGSGSTFALPVISAWKTSFLNKRADGSDFFVDDLGVDYEPVGSLAGIMRLAQADIDFAASDAPLPPDELTKRDLAQFPLVMGGLAVVVNLDALPTGTLKLSGDVLAKIYLGQIKNWNDPAITALNPGFGMPDLAIAPLHRADGSGSTLTWTRYLSAANAEWKAGPGADTLVEWPAAGKAAEGTSGLIALTKATPGAIAYVEFGQAQRQDLPAAQITNRAGNFVAPSAEIFASTAASAQWDATKGFYLQLADADTADAYPLAAVTFALMHKTQRSSARTRRTLFFLAHGLDYGGKDAAALGFVALPAPLVEKIKTYWHETLPGAAGL